MELSHEFLVEDREFKDYDDFKANCRLKTIPDFNFAYDIVDRYAKDCPGKRALVWIDDNNDEETFTFDDISRESKRAAYWLTSKGIKKGDTVMLILRRRYEWWILMPALHRIGAIVIPATDQLLQSDIEYRTNAADVKMIITYNNPNIIGEIEKSMPKSPSVKYLVTVGEPREGWLSFHEEYERIYSRSVKGYTFICSHWDDGKGPETRAGFDASGEKLAAFLSDPRNRPDSAKPFFYCQHPHPAGTVYGEACFAGTGDTGVSTKTLVAYPNAIAISGHSHYSITDERSIWQGAFTSIGAGSLRYTEPCYASFPPRHFENWRGYGKKFDAIDTTKTMPPFKRDCRQGMLMDVYDDRIVFARREFSPDIPLGDDWVVPLGRAAEKPYAFDNAVQRSRGPDFPAGSLISVCSKADAKSGVDMVSLDFPAADSRKGARVFSYEVVAEGDGGERRSFRVLADGFNHGLGHPLVKMPVKVDLPRGELPGGDLKFRVTAHDCWDNPGRPIGG